MGTALLCVAAGILIGAAGLGAGVLIYIARHPLIP